MRLIVRGDCLNPALNQVIRRHLVFALSRYQSWIEKATLDWYEEDGGAAQGALLYRCKLRLRFRNCETAVVSNASDDLLEAMRLSADQASRLAARRWSAFQQHSVLSPVPGR